jgi:hypothetical protein
MRFGEIGVEAHAQLFGHLANGHTIVIIIADDKVGRPVSRPTLSSPTMLMPPPCGQHCANSGRQSSWGGHGGERPYLRAATGESGHSTCQICGRPRGRAATAHVRSVAGHGRPPPQHMSDLWAVTGDAATSVGGHGGRGHISGRPRGAAPTSRGGPPWPPPQQYQCVWLKICYNPTATRSKRQTRGLLMNTVGKRWL